MERVERNVYKVAEEAWKTAKLGVLTDIRGWRVVKLRKIVLVTKPLEDLAFRNQLGSHMLDVVAYPKPEHMVEFAKARRGLKNMGPADDYLGSISSVRVWIHSESGRAGDFVDLEHAQAHFKTGKEAPYLRRGLATYYGGWRRHALKRAVEIAHRHGRTFRVSGDLLNFRRRDSGLTPLNKDLFGVAKELRRSISIDRHLYIFPREKQ